MLVVLDKEQAAATVRNDTYRLTYGSLTRLVAGEAFPRTEDTRLASAKPVSMICLSILWLQWCHWYKSLAEWYVAAQHGKKTVPKFRTLVIAQQWFGFTRCFCTCIQ